MKKANQENIALKLELIKPQAEANGADAVQIRAVTYDKITEVTVPETDIVLIVDGNALFKNTNAPIYKTKTGDDGSIIIDVVNNRIEKNIIECHLFDSNEISQFVNISFYNEIPVLAIDSIYNINHTFSEGEPSICWDGAYFYIATKGGSGNLTWSVNNEPASFLFENISENKVKVTIKNEIKKENILTCVDSITHECINFSLKIKKHALISTSKVDYKDLIKNAKAHEIFKKIDYDLLFREWGSISSYPEWEKDNEYWTDEHNQLLNTVYIYNLDTGTSHNVKMNDYKLNYLFTVGATPY
ncbi:hypothetical protein [Proteus hauseri]|uniref:hypothetical protein n=1 Tax=Proteus hauseri TaxID=183417 RepID=UPI0032DB3B00